MSKATISNPEWWEQRQCCDGSKFYYNIATNERTKLNPTRGPLPPDQERRAAATIHEWTTHLASPLYSQPTAHSVLRIIWRDVEMHLPRFRVDLEQYKKLRTRATFNAELVQSLDDNLQAIETWRAMAETQVEKLEKNAAASGRNINVEGLRRNFDAFGKAVDAATQEMIEGWLTTEHNMYLLKLLEVFFSSLRRPTWDS
ncbi:hypothetical protein BGAL_0411g00080 [Botrytis galanthina]|uniref:WW domain-containing protein n=1 Tax=Botrytis galanthina TaxID=278940 RepID=A0A4S8QNB1_9HELO|nr:hypothetical protein BGAL_0411g00080 [Botrytis galanthina]